MKSQLKEKEDEVEAAKKQNAEIHRFAFFWNTPKNLGRCIHLILPGFDSCFSFIFNPI